MMGGRWRGEREGLEMTRGLSLLLGVSPFSRRQCCSQLERGVRQLHRERQGCSCTPTCTYMYIKLTMELPLCMHHVHVLTTTTCTGVGQFTVIQLLHSIPHNTNIVTHDNKIACWL